MPNIQINGLQISIDEVTTNVTITEARALYLQLRDIFDYNSIPNYVGLSNHNTVRDVTAQAANVWAQTGLRS